MKFESFEKIPPSRDKVVEILINQGIDDLEAKAILTEYVIEQEQLSDINKGPYAHEKVALHMAVLYFDAHYAEYALESLDELEDLLMHDQGTIVEGELITISGGEDAHTELLKEIRKIRDKMLEELG